MEVGEGGEAKPALKINSVFPLLSRSDLSCLSVSRQNCHISTDQ